jgi:hypothetical protein
LRLQRGHRCTLGRLIGRVRCGGVPRVGTLECLYGAFGLAGAAVVQSTEEDGSAEQQDQDRGHATGERLPWQPPTARHASGRGRWHTPHHRAKRRQRLPRGDARRFAAGEDRREGALVVQIVVQRGQR